MLWLLSNIEVSSANLKSRRGAARMMVVENKEGNDTQLSKRTM